MRWMLALAVAAGCGGADRVAALEQRTTALEARPLAEPDPRVRKLERRVEELEQQVDDLTERLQRALDVAIATPPPVPPPAAAPRRPGLDRDRVYPIPLGDSTAFGPANAAVTLVAAVQFPEPYSHKSWPVLQALRTEYAQQLRIVVKTFTVHPQAVDSTITACAAARQGELDAYEAAVWDAGNPPDSPRRWPEAAELRELAKALRLDLKQYDRDVAGACRSGHTRDQALFTRLGQTAVPVFWINGRPLEGAMPIEQFRAMIDDELVKAKADRANGGKPASYYDRLMRGALAP